MCNAAKAEWQARPLQRDSQPREAATRRRRWKPRRPRVTIKQEQLQRKAAPEAKAGKRDIQTREAATRRRRGKPRQPKATSAQEKLQRERRGKPGHSTGTIRQEQLQRDGGAGSQGSPKRPSNKRNCRQLCGWRWRREKDDHGERIRRNAIND